MKGGKSIENTVNTHQLREIVTAVHGTDYNIKSTNDGAVMSGLFNFSDLASGISVHCNDSIEMQNMSSCIELPPCLSFNVVFNGKINFNLGESDFFIGREHASPVECSAIILNQSDIMTRHMKFGEHVTKVNIFIEQSWLKDRCKNEKDLELFNCIFANHLSLYKWQASNEIIEVAKQILQSKVNLGFSNELMIEQLALQFLNQSIDALVSNIKATSNKINKKRKYKGANLTIKKQIDELLCDPVSLEEIANTIGLSISTLQRRFKKDYGTTVVDYIRQKRLEKARIAIAINGLSIGEAAYQAGYNHSSNFITAFKKRFNITPASLLKSHQLG